jgi:predicted RNA-binding protein
MCQSSVWVRYPDGHTEKIADDVLYATQAGEEVVLRWFLKDPWRVTGDIREVDAVKHVIMLDVTEAPVVPHPIAEPTTAQPEHEHPHVHPHPH